jgi:uncharacterized protein (DUF433 family)
MSVSTVVPSPLITSSPDRLGGTPVFAGTRVPVQSLFDHLEGGDPLDVFLDQFPSVGREHAVAVLELEAHAGRADRRGVTRIPLPRAGPARCQPTARPGPAPGGARSGQHPRARVDAHAWSDLDDGALLTAAAAVGYAAFLTMDQSLRFQQNLIGRPLAVVLLRARSNRLPDLAPLAPAVLAALPVALPGEVTVIAA